MRKNFLSKNTLSRIATLSGTLVMILFVFSPVVNSAPNSFQRISQSKIEILKNIISSSKNSRELERRYSSAVHTIYYSNSRWDDFRLCITESCIDKAGVADEDDMKIKISDNLDTQKEVLNTITDQIIKYPIKFDLKALPETIVIANEIDYLGIERGAINFESSYKQVIIMSDKYLNKDDYYAVTFNHELYHNLKRDELLIDFDIDIKWRDIDRREYKEKYEDIYKTDSLFEIKDGYVSAYSKSYMEEDQAEVYAFYIDRILSGRQTIESIDDLVVRRKLMFMDEIFLERVLDENSRY